jgi:hypothetical protein
MKEVSAEIYLKSEEEMNFKVEQKSTFTKREIPQRSELTLD